MNLLPKSHEEFAQTEYWNTFFKKRGEKAFEWYGEYLDLCEQIHKYIKPPHQILVVGCGNSRLSMDMYDSGFHNIVNIDISEVAIKRMKELNAKKRPEMTYLQVDATSMIFCDATFNVALDKGTLDALFVNDSPEVCETVERYFLEIKRVLINGGRYLCVSLLQEHILKYMLEFFPKNEFMLRIVNCREYYCSREKNGENGDSMDLPVFFIVATKFKSLPEPILEFSLDKEKMQRLKTTKDLFDAVASVQKAALICNGLARSNIVGLSEVTLDLCVPGEITPRYTVHVLDQPPSRTIGRYAAFIVPQGRETEWLYVTPEGRKKLLESALHQRLAIVTLHRDKEYNSFDEVKTELTETIKLLGPKNMTGQIPFLSIGDDLGKRETLVSGCSQISGDFRIEEIDSGDGKILRRLIFLSNQSVVQSEALIKIIKGKGKNKKERKKVDVGYLACNHHLFMSVGVQMAINMPSQNNLKDDTRDTLVIGLGGGGLCTFLREVLPKNARITAVEIDPIMLELAEQYFELRQDKQFHVVIDDGIHFLERCKNEDIHFNAVLFDVDSKDLSLGMSCPPPGFLEATVLENCKEIIGPKGLFILNFVCRDESLRAKTLDDLRKTFSSVCSYKLTEDLNEIFYCCNDEKYKLVDDWKNVLSSSGCLLNDAVKDHKLSSTEMLDVADFLKDLKI